MPLSARAATCVRIQANQSIDTRHKPNEIVVEIVVNEIVAHDFDFRPTSVTGLDPVSASFN